VNIISVKAAKIFLFFFPSPMQACNVLLQLNISSSAMLSWSVVRARPTAAVNWPLEYFLDEDLHKKHCESSLGW
jgi:hypothetical protein